MLYFDHRPQHVLMVSKLGLLGVSINKGMTLKVLHQGIRQFQAVIKSAAIFENKFRLTLFDV